MTTNSKFIIGNQEWCALPELGIPAVRARVDSGAKTSSLHAFNIQPFERDGSPWVRFDVHPVQNDDLIEVRCERQVVDRRVVKNSGGNSEDRYVIRTPIRMNSDVWDIELTLTNRDSMGFRMLLGREAMNGRIIVDPSIGCALGDISKQEISVHFSKSKDANQEIREPSEADALTSGSAGQAPPPKMRIAILSRNKKLYSTKRLVEAGRARGHQVDIIDTMQCYMDITKSRPVVRYKGEELPTYDAVIPRIGASVTFYGTAVVRQFEMMGTFSVNESVAISRSRDKLRSLQLMSRKGVGLPRTGFANKSSNIKDLIKTVGGAPLVVKLLEGTQGIGVVLAENTKTAESVIEAFMGLKANILVQEFIKEAGGADIRCFVVGDKVVAAMKRQGAEGEFRSNLHRGGSAKLIRLTKEERATAVAAAKVMGLGLCGVDILQSNSGPVVMEVNSTPGLEGIEKATGKDVAEMIYMHIEKNAKPFKTKMRGKG
jgi:ribosomal protein S6--L-glutamate ligase